MLAVLRFHWSKAVFRLQGFIPIRNRSGQRMLDSISNKTWKYQIHMKRWKKPLVSNPTNRLICGLGLPPTSDGFSRWDQVDSWGGSSLGMIPPLIGINTWEAGSDWCSTMHSWLESLLSVLPVVTSAFGKVLGAGDCVQFYHRTLLHPLTLCRLQSVCQLASKNAGDNKQTSLSI